MICLWRVGTVSLVVMAILLLPRALPTAWGEAAGASRSKSAQPGCNRSTFRMVVDVGHTAKVPGAMSARGVNEYEFNLRLAKQIEQRLIDAGFARTVLLITAAPPYRGLVERVMRANSLPADLFLSIHHDSVPDSFLETWEYDGQQLSFSDRFKGHSIFVSYENGNRTGSLVFGRLLGQELQGRGLQYTPHYTEKFMGHRRRELVDAEAGVYRYDQLVVLKATRMPAVLLEAGSIINRDEELAMDSSERQSLISAAVIDAVERFCATGRPRDPAPVARRPGAGTVPKQTFSPAAATRPENSVKH